MSDEEIVELRAERDAALANYQRARDWWERDDAARIVAVDELAALGAENARLKDQIDRIKNMPKHVDHQGEFLWRDDVLAILGEEES